MYSHGSMMSEVTVYPMVDTPASDIVSLLRKVAALPVYEDVNMLWYSILQENSMLADVSPQLISILSSTRVLKQSPTTLLTLSCCTIS